MKIAIIGSGALGLYYGAMLQRAGHDVSFLLRSDYHALVSKGLRVTSPNGDFHLPTVKGFLSAKEMGVADLVVIGLKTFSNDQLISLCRPVIGANTAILTLQNGLGNEDLLAEAFGREKVLGGVAFLCSNRGEPGTVHHLGQGMIRLGEVAGGLSDRARQIATLFQGAGVPCEAVADLKKARWEKLVWNIPFNGLCALTRQPTGKLLSLPEMRREVASLMEEVIAGANAQGISQSLDAKTLVPHMLEFTDGMGDYSPSMMIDRIEGRPLELDAIYGIALQEALDKGVDMRKVRLLHALLLIGEKI